MALSFFVDALDDSFLDRFLDGNAVEGPSHAIATVVAVLNNLIEEGVPSPMG